MVGLADHLFLYRYSVSDSEMASHEGDDMSDADSTFELVMMLEPIHPLLATSVKPSLLFQTMPQHVLCTFKVVEGEEVKVCYKSQLLIH